jgi:ribose/xylose/arabinose/galactoside ABC-type transport system permease subunit
MASRLNSGQPLAGTGFELNVISAVILGGVSMTGGRGKISGALLGVFILYILTNILVLLNVSSFYQQIARGIVLIIAVFFDERRRAGLNKSLLKESNE